MSTFSWLSRTFFFFFLIFVVLSTEPRVLFHWVTTLWFLLGFFLLLIFWFQDRMSLGCQFALKFVILSQPQLQVCSTIPSTSSMFFLIFYTY